MPARAPRVTEKGYRTRPINTLLGDYGTQEGSKVATSFGGLIFGNDSGDIIGGGKERQHFCRQR
jgi:hypothetical protein